MKSSIYGDTLLSSPEAFQSAVMFSQNPVVNGGYVDQTQGVPVRLIFKDETSGVKDANGVWVRTVKKTVWSRKALVVGTFLLFEDIVSRIMTDSGWKRQAGFFIYGLDKVVGDNGSPSYDPKANNGGRDF